MAISVNPYVSPRIITVLADVSITMQQLVNQVMDWEEMSWNLTHERIVKAGGKQDLGGGAKVGITATLLNAKVRFEDQSSPTVCTIYGGNLVAVDANGFSMSPIESATNVTVVLAQSSSPTLIQGEAEWTQTEKNELVARVVGIQSTADILQSAIDSVQMQIDSVQVVADSVHSKIGETQTTSTDVFDRERESLSAIRKKLDGLKVSGGRPFGV